MTTKKKSRSHKTVSSQTILCIWIFNFLVLQSKYIYLSKWGVREKPELCIMPHMNVKVFLKDPLRTQIHNHITSDKLSDEKAGTLYLSDLISGTQLAILNMSYQCIMQSIKLERNYVRQALYCLAIQPWVEWLSLHYTKLGSSS